MSWICSHANGRLIFVFNLHHPVNPPRHWVKCRVIYSTTLAKFMTSWCIKSNRVSWCFPLRFFSVWLLKDLCPALERISLEPPILLTLVRTLSWLHWKVFSLMCFNCFTLHIFETMKLECFKNVEFYQKDVWKVLSLFFLSQEIKRQSREGLRHCTWFIFRFSW